MGVLGVHPYDIKYLYGSKADPKTPSSAVVMGFFFLTVSHVRKTSLTPGVTPESLMCVFTSFVVCFDNVLNYVNHLT